MAREKRGVKIDVLGRNSGREEERAISGRIFVL